MLKKIRMVIIAVVLLGAAGAIVSAPQISKQFVGPPRPEGLEETRYLPTAEDAIIWAWYDIFTVPYGERCFTRYIWHQVPDEAKIKATSAAVNIPSRGRAIYRPIPRAGGHLLRVDLRKYAPKAQDLKDWLHYWEEFQFDPTFSRLDTKDAINFANKLDREITRVVIVPGIVRFEKRIVYHQGGDLVYPDDSNRWCENVAPGKYELELRFKTPDEKKEIKEIVKGPDVDVIRSNADHINPIAFISLQEQTQSLAPVVEHNYFKTRILTTIKDDDENKLFGIVFGGLYYEFAGIKKAKDVLGKDTKATDLDLFFESLGIGNIQAGVTADVLFDGLGSDQRLAMLQSFITGKPRVVSSFHLPSDKEGGAWGAITLDIKDKDVDIGDRGFANLLNPRVRAREGLFPWVTGWQRAIIVNGNGALVNEVPPDVTLDTTIPNPYTKRLQPFISCYRCHVAEGSDGWKPMDNNIKTMLSFRSGSRSDLFGDLSNRVDPFSSDVIDRLAGLYEGDFAKNIRRAREDIAEVSLKTSGPWKDGGDQTNAAQLTAKAVCADFAFYNYTLVDARLALQDMGIYIDKSRAVETFRAIVPPDIRSTVLGAYVPEDPRIVALRAGLGINRSDWALVQNFAQERALKVIHKAKGEMR